MRSRTSATKHAQSRCIRGNRRTSRPNVKRARSGCAPSADAGRCSRRWRRRREHENPALVGARRGQTALPRHQNRSAISASPSSNHPTGKSLERFRTTSLKQVLCVRVGADRDGELASTTAIVPARSLFLNVTANTHLVGSVATLLRAAARLISHIYVMRLTCGSPRN